MLQSACGPEDTVYYMVGKEKFIGVSINEEFLTNTLKKMGFCDITIKCFSCDTPELNIPTEECDFPNAHFAIATKKL